MTIFRVCAVLIKAISIVLHKWLTADAVLRAEYNRDVHEASQQILQKVYSGSLSPEEGALKAHECRNILLARSRARSSPVGLLTVRWLKPSQRPLEYYLNNYSKYLYGKKVIFSDLDLESKIKV